MQFKKPPSILHLLGMLIVFPALGYLAAILNISLNPFEVVAPWIVILVLVVVFIGFLSGLLGSRFSKRLTSLTPLQWLGFGVFLALLSLGGYLLGPYREIGGVFSPFVVAIVLFSIQAVGMRKQSQSWNRAPTY